jgi:hypothetical protein
MQLRTGTPDEKDTHSRLLESFSTGFLPGVGNWIR